MTARYSPFVRGQESALRGEPKPSRGRTRAEEEFYFGWLGGDYLRRQGVNVF